MDSTEENINHNEKLIHDPIHQSIKIHPLCVKIIDTPEFQRLRYLKQLGCSQFVYPSATHTRFEHSIGVYHLSRRVIQKLNEQLKNDKQETISEQDELCVSIAGLCHDLGHGPFSHMWEGFVKLKNVEWKHEEMSVEIFNRVWDKLEKNVEKYGLDDSHRRFIGNLIQGKREDETKRQFLFEIVNNGNSGIDVDKWDYVTRDCYYVGFKCTFDFERLLQFIRVNRDNNDNEVICFRNSETLALYNLFITRWYLHRQTYKHRVSRIVEKMMLEAFDKANDDLLTRGKDGTRYKLAECIDDVDAFLKLNDAIFHRIQWELEPTHEAVKLVDRIERRNIYKRVAKKLLKKKPVMLETEIVKIAPELQDKFYIDVISFDYGKEDQNPMRIARFYTKEKRTLVLPADQIPIESYMLPDQFMEVIVSCVSKSDDPETMEKLNSVFQLVIERVKND